MLKLLQTCTCIGRRLLQSRGRFTLISGYDLCSL